jgi:hypothetical protein
MNTDIGFSLAVHEYFVNFHLQLLKVPQRGNLGYVAVAA